MDDGEALRVSSVAGQFDDIGVAELGTSLKDKRIALAIGGGIAAIESPQIARALRRLGAEVQAYATEQAMQFIGSRSLEWATARPVVTTPSGLAEHVSNHDAVLVSCATADLISKAALGICSDGVSTLIQSAFGNKTPVILAPTMHDSLAAAPAVMRNLALLQGEPNLTVLQARLEEGKHKIRRADEIADEVSHAIHAGLLSKSRATDKHRRVLLSFGGTRAPLDRVRSVSNRSSGALGQSFIGELYRWGYTLDVLRGETSVPSARLDGIDYCDSPSYTAMRDNFLARDPSKYRGVFMLAAVSDYAYPEEPTGIKLSSSMGALAINLPPAQKLVDTSNFQKYPFRFACKLTSDVSDDSRQAVKHLASRSGAQVIYWNTVDEAFGNKAHCGRIWQTGTPVEESLLCTSKHAVARLAIEVFRHIDQKEGPQRELASI